MEILFNTWPNKYKKLIYLRNTEKQNHTDGQA
jgi:hypothetical protein